MTISRVPNEDERLRAAAFLQEVFGPDAETELLAAELEVLSSDAASFTYTIELSSSIGDAAFLIYQFAFGKKRSDGKWGRELYRDGLETLELAIERNTPGPRIVAHAETDDEGYLLATTPATYRLLAGNDTNTSSTIAPTAMANTDTAAVRKQSADELLRLLRMANDQAMRWLAAIRDEGNSTQDDDDIPFNQEEAALALFLNDNSSVQDLLRLMAMMVESSRPTPSS